MNKQKFVDFLRRPHNISDKDLEEVRTTIKEFPYFQSARTILAKASKIKNLPSAKSEITRASIYSSDRAHLKKYILGNLVFLRPLDVHDSHQDEIASAQPTQIEAAADITTKGTITDSSTVKQAPNVSQQKASIEKTKPNTSNQTNKEEVKLVPKEAVKPTSVKNENIDQKPEIKPTGDKPELSKKSVDSVVPKSDLSIDKIADSTTYEVPKGDGDLDHLIQDIFAELASLKQNRAKLVALEKKIEEEDAVNDAVKKATKKAEDSKSELELSPDSTLVESKEEPEIEAIQEEITEVDESKTSVKPGEIEQEDSSKKTTTSSTHTPPKSSIKNEKSSEQLKTIEDKSEKEVKAVEVVPIKEDKKKPVPRKKPTPRKSAKKSSTSETEKPKAPSKNSTSVKKAVVKGESAIEKAAAKMRASGKIKDSDGPEIRKGESKVNNTPPEKIIKTYIRKRSSERSSKQEGDNADATEGNSKDKPGSAQNIDPNSIIEDFIKNQPSITAKKDPPETSLGDLSEQSTSLNPEIASEYLAEIFLEQDKKGHAISIYEQLILKFPDKSAYFADIIKKLKN